MFSKIWLKGKWLITVESICVIKQPLIFSCDFRDVLMESGTHWNVPGWGRETRIITLLKMALLSEHSEFIQNKWEVCVMLNMK